MNIKDYDIWSRKTVKKSLFVVSSFKVIIYDIDFEDINVVMVERGIDVDVDVNDIDPVVIKVVGLCIKKREKIQEDYKIRIVIHYLISSWVVINYLKIEGNDFQIIVDNRIDIKNMVKQSKQIIEEIIEKIEIEIIFIILV